jgi:hypothetical protein
MNITPAELRFPAKLSAISDGLTRRAEEHELAGVCGNQLGPDFVDGIAVHDATRPIGLNGLKQAGNMQMAFYVQLYDQLMFEQLAPRMRHVRKRQLCSRLPVYSLL